MVRLGAKQTIRCNLMCCDTPTVNGVSRGIRYLLVNPNCVHLQNIEHMRAILNQMPVDTSVKFNGFNAAGDLRIEFHSSAFSGQRLLQITYKAELNYD